MVLHVWAPKAIVHINSLHGTLENLEHYPIHDLEAQKAALSDPLSSPNTPREGHQERDGYSAGNIVRFEFVHQAHAARKEAITRPADADSHGGDHI